MELKPIIKKDTPLQLILVYELGKDQIIDIPYVIPLDSTLNTLIAEVDSIVSEILQLAEKWAINIVKKESITVSEQEYTEMYRACTDIQKELFDKIFK